MKESITVAGRTSPTLMPELRVTVRSGLESWCHMEASSKAPEQVDKVKQRWKVM